MAATTTDSRSSVIGADFTERFVSAAGFEIRYLEAGEGTPIVCLPGAGGPRLSRALDLLAAQYRVIVVELPGWGAQANHAADFDALATQAAAAVAAIGLTSYHLMGTSLGGACALHLVTLFPERVVSLTLEAPAEFRANSLDPATAPPELLGPAFRTHPERLPHFELPTPEFMERVWPLVGRLMGDGSVNTGFVDRLRAVTTRTLLLWGRDDRLIHPCNAALYRSVMTNAALMFVYDAAHDIQGDRPEAFADVVADFVRRGMNFLVNEADGLINP